MRRQVIFRDKKVLVTGGAGFVGSHLVKRLLSSGSIVRATIHTKPPVVCDDRIEYVKCNLQNRDDCIKVVEGMDYAFLCAANSSGAAGTFSSSLDSLRSNMIMNMQLFGALSAARVKKVLFISSTTAYPEAGSRPLKEEEFFNQEPYGKYFAVGWMNRFSEVLCRIYCEKAKNKITTVVLRPANIYGEHDDFNLSTSHVLPALVRKIVERCQPLEVWGNGNDIRDFIYIDDFIDAVMLAMEKINSYRPVNIGSGKGCSIKQLLQTILEVDGWTDAKIEFNISRPSMIPIRLIDTKKAEELLGFKAKTGLKEGIEKTIRWFRSQGTREQLECEF